MTLTILDLHRLVKAHLDQGFVGEVFDAEPSQKTLLGIREYLILFTGMGAVTWDRMSTTVARVGQSFPIMCVGRTVEDTLDCAQQCRDLLHGWDVAPSDLGVSRLFEDQVNVPLLPYRSVEGDTRYSLTPTYRLAHDR